MTTEERYKQEQRERYGKEPQSLSQAKVEDERFLEYSLSAQAREIMGRIMDEHDRLCRDGFYDGTTWYIVDGSFCGWPEGRELRTQLPSLRGIDTEAGFAWNVRKPDELFNISIARTE